MGVHYEFLSAVEEHERRVNDIQDTEDDVRTRRSQAAMVEDLRAPTAPTYASQKDQQEFIDKQKRFISKLESQIETLKRLNHALHINPAAKVLVGAICHVYFPSQFYDDDWPFDRRRPLCTASHVQPLSPLVAYLDAFSSQFMFHHSMKHAYWCYGCARIFDKLTSVKQGSFPFPRIPYKTMNHDLLVASTFIVNPDPRSHIIVTNYSFCPFSAYYADITRYSWAVS